jgi:cytochrome c oxidase assembly protein subunit 15
VCALVVLMLVVGGVTRLTGSGLSIVEWRPVVGAVPPLDDASWNEAFGAYRASPQGQLVNFGISLGEFKRIFFWEYLHRLLGRFIGAAFALPGIYFAVKGQVRPRTVLAGLALIGLQGALGWGMVRTGLGATAHVSHYWLAAHLSLALVLLGYLTWTWLDVRRANEPARPSLRWALRGVLVVLAAQIVYGAFTAGLHAGVGYNTFPKMNGAWIPPEAFTRGSSMLDDRASVQLVHRTLGTILVVAIAALAAFAWRAPRAVRRAIGLVLAAVLVQFSLGIGTLLLFVPLHLAAAHQLGAVLLLLAAVRAVHLTRAIDGASQRARARSARSRSDPSPTCPARGRDCSRPTQAP